MGSRHIHRARVAVSGFGLAAALALLTPSAADAQSDEAAAVEEALWLSEPAAEADPSFEGGEGAGRDGFETASPRRPLDVGMVYIDRELAPRAARSAGRFVRASLGGGGGDAAPGESLRAHPLYRELSDGLRDYRDRWGSLPQIDIPSGPALRPGDEGERVRLLRRRLGLDPEGSFDTAVARAVRDYQKTHGLEADGIAGAGTIASLNRGAGHYERLVRINMERARALPSDPGDRYILVDAAAARLWLYEDGRPQGTMRVIVGKRSEPTPMMAGLIRYAVVNPYWNIPPDLVRDKVAPAVLSEGLSYLRDRRYEVLSDWTEDAEKVDPEEVDWEAVAAGRKELRVRQLPGAGNMMGEIKFMFPNRFGVYLHDTPDKALFDEADRRLSSGCVRLEDARRLARWLFGSVPRADSPDAEQAVPLPDPVPVYITYMTAAADGDGIVFREDVYGRDRELLARLEARGDSGGGSGRVTR